MGRNIILFDVDHTISDAFWRDDLIKRSRDSGDWEEYHSKSKEDKPIMDIVTLITLLAVVGDPFELYAITARPERWRKQTMEWFRKHGVMIDVLLMRPESAFKAAPKIKVDLCREEGILDNILCLFDDREDVVAAFRELGITAFQVFAARREEA